MWGLFGPIEFKTKRGNRIIFVGGFVTLPLTLYSIYKLQTSFKTHQERANEERSSGGRDIDLSER
jgi:hypothetical protein